MAKISLEEEDEEIEGDEEKRYSGVRYVERTIKYGYFYRHPMSLLTLGFPPLFYLFLKELLGGIDLIVFLIIVIPLALYIAFVNSTIHFIMYIMLVAIGVIGSLNPGFLFVKFFISLLFIKIPTLFYRLEDPERAAFHRFGKYKKMVGPGWFLLLFPFKIDTVKIVDIRMEQIIVDPQPVVTKDKIWFQIAPTIFMYVSDAEKAIRNVQDYKKAVVDYVIAALTSICGAQTSDYIITHMDKISRDLEEGAAKLGSVPGREWGVEVPRIEIKSVEFPEKVQDAMHDRVAAEQRKLAAHEQAEAQKVVIDAVREAGAKLTDPAITYLYLQTLDKMARGKATKIVLPMELARIAETITGQAGGLNQDQIDELQTALDTYEKKIKVLEGKMKKKDDEIKVLEGKPKSSPEDREELKKDIERIKKRIEAKK